jgi:hypothetical protein
MLLPFVKSISMFLIVMLYVRHSVVICMLMPCHCEMIYISLEECDIFGSFNESLDNGSRVKSKLPMLEEEL